MSKVAVVENGTGVVVNVIVAELTDPAPAGFKLVLVPPELFMRFGLEWDQATKDFVPNEAYLAEKAAKRQEWSTISNTWVPNAELAAELKVIEDAEQAILDTE